MSANGTGFDYTLAMERLIRHIVAGSPEFAHIQPDRMLISFTQSKSPGAHGVYASIQPLRFEGGSPTTLRRGRTWAMPDIVRDGRHILYIVYFALPRFANLSFADKIITIFHELYHVSPDFNGDVRRFPGRKYAHGHSRKTFNKLVKSIADNYLRTAEHNAPLAFLRSNFDELRAEHGFVHGTRIRPPKPQLV